MESPRLLRLLRWPSSLTLPPLPPLEKRYVPPRAPTEDSNCASSSSPEEPRAKGKWQLTPAFIKVGLCAVLVLEWDKQ